MFNLEKCSFNLSDISYFHLHLAFKSPFKNMKYIFAIHFPDLTNEEGIPLQILYTCATLCIYKKGFQRWGGTAVPHLRKKSNPHEK